MARSSLLGFAVVAVVALSAVACNRVRVEDVRGPDGGEWTRVFLPLLLREFGRPSARPSLEEFAQLRLPPVDREAMTRFRLPTLAALTLAALAPTYAACSGAPPSGDGGGPDLGDHLHDSPERGAEGGAGSEPATGGHGDGGAHTGDGGTSACDVGTGQLSTIATETRYTTSYGVPLIRYQDGKLYTAGDERGIQVIPVNGGSSARITPLFTSDPQELFVTPSSIYYRDSGVVRMTLLGTNEQIIDARTVGASYMDSWGGYRHSPGHAVDNSDNTITALRTSGGYGAAVHGALTTYMAADENYAFLTSDERPVGEASHLALIRLPRSLDVNEAVTMSEGVDEHPTALVVDATRVYLATDAPTGNLVSVGKDGTDFRVVSNRSGIRILAADSLDVYWVEGTALMRVAKDGSGTPVKAFVACESIDGIAPGSGAGVYFTSHKGKKHTVWKITR